MADETTTVAQLRARWKEFVSQREWDQYHTAKNLSMALAAEAAELMELFLWVEGPESNQLARGERGQATRDEVADVAGVLLAFCNALDIDLSQAIREKMDRNEKKYPADKIRGRWRMPQDEQSSGGSSGLGETNGP